MRRTRKPAFTLIEMLVVIAIIGVLAAILLPALHRMQQIARKSYCQNNLTQFGIALEKYLTYYDGWYPVSGNSWCSRSTRDPAGTPYFPVDLMCQMMGKEAGSPSYAGYAAGLVEPRQCLKVCYCPSTTLHEGAALFDRQDPLKQYWWNGHIDGAGPLTDRWKSRANLWEVIGSQWDWPDWCRESGTGWFRIVYSKKAVVSHPSDLVVMGDTPDHDGRYFPAGWAWLDAAGPTRYGVSSVSRRHMGGSNLLYLDGHVNWKHWDYLEVQENSKQWLIVVEKDDDVFYVEIP
jgi:prepilin-type N-terminal cleavage/methylation domain-containing protein/prepilin-type processing-associated H-X9-DG protein